MPYVHGQPTRGETVAREDVGCCGAYCKACHSSRAGTCRSCTRGYNEGERDIARAKCKIKLCCFRDHHLQTCADCDTFDGCIIIHAFHAKKEYKYGKYRKAITFIREHGYDTFVAIADRWNNAHGKYPP